MTEILSDFMQAELRENTRKKEQTIISNVAGNVDSDRIVAVYACCVCGTWKMQSYFILILNKRAFTFFRIITMPRIAACMPAYVC